MNIIWFRNDLRIEYNPALSAALSSEMSSEMSAETPCVAVFIHATQTRQAIGIGPGPDGFYLQHAAALIEACQSKGLQTLFIETKQFQDAANIFRRLHQALGFETLFFNREYTTWEAQRDASVRTALAELGVSVKSFDDRLIVPPGEVLQGQDTFYKVFTPFKKRWLQGVNLQQIQNTLGLKDPFKTMRPLDDQTAQKLKQLDLPSSPKAIWPQLKSDESQVKFTVGEKHWHKRLQHFLDGPIKHYHDQRDKPSVDGTSGLSPALAIGAISAKYIFLQLMDRFFQRDNPLAPTASNQGPSVFLSELIWRDFYTHVMVGYPHVGRNQNFKSGLKGIEWNTSSQDFQRWCQGTTGVPLVDAGMRQLVQTGWMHNRVRMVTAMFLTKNLLIDWRKGEAFFMAHLLDGDFASNNGGWQWSASTGTDAAPYFRIFNPLAQAERFDEEVKYIQCFVPELKKVSAKVILNAQKYQTEITQYGYPALMVDVKQSRADAIAVFKALNQKA